MNIKGHVIDVYVYRRQQSGLLQFLLLRRALDRIYAGQWRMIGGKMQDSETAWEAAFRELKEETGRDAVQMWTVPSANVFYEWQQDRMNVIPVFAATIDGDPVLNHEHDRYEWLSLNEAAERLVWPEQSRLIRLVGTMLEKAIPDELCVFQKGTDGIS